MKSNKAQIYAKRHKISGIQFEDPLQHQSLPGTRKSDVWAFAEWIQVNGDIIEE